MNNHTPLAEVNEFHHLGFSHLSREKLIKKCLLEDFISHRPSSKRSFISPLHIPCLGHILELVCGQLGLLICIHPHSIKYLVYLINKFLGVFLNLRPLEGRRIHPSDVPKMGSHSGNLLINPRCNLPIVLGRHSLGMNCCGLGLSSDGLVHFINHNPHLGLRQRWRISRSLIITKDLLKGRNLITMGRSSRISNILHPPSRIPLSINFL